MGQSWDSPVRKLARELDRSLQHGISSQTIRKGCTTLLELAVTRARAATDLPDDLAVAAEQLLREAITAADEEGNAAILFGSAPGTRGVDLGLREMRIAQQVGCEVSTVRKRRRPKLVRAVAERIHAVDAEHRRNQGLSRAGVAPAANESGPAPHSCTPRRLSDALATAGSTTAVDSPARLTMGPGSTMCRSRSRVLRPGLRLYELEHVHGPHGLRQVWSASYSSGPHGSNASRTLCDPPRVRMSHREHPLRHLVPVDEPSPWNIALCEIEPAVYEPYQEQGLDVWLHLSRLWHGYHPAVPEFHSVSVTPPFTGMRRLSFEVVSTDQFHTWAWGSETRHLGTSSSSSEASSLELDANGLLSISYANPTAGSTYGLDVAVLREASSRHHGSGHDWHGPYRALRRRVDEARRADRTPPPYDGSPASLFEATTA